MIAQSRRLRLMWLIILELGRKYTRFLALGFGIGLVSSILLGRAYPVIFWRWFVPVERIGIVGEFTPSALPLPIQTLISSGLTKLSADGSPQPALATNWEATESGKTFTFTLRADLRWHNGKPVVASDVNYNIKNVTFTALGSTVLRTTLHSSYSPFPTLVAKPLFLSGLRGFGPYRVENIQLKGDKVQLIRLVPVAPTLGKPREYRFYRTESLAKVAFKLGEVNALEDITSLDSLSKWGKVEVTETTRFNRIVTLFFNLKQPLLGEKSIRQALAYGIPQMAEERAYSPISKTSWAYSDGVKKYLPNPTQTKKLLANSQAATASAELTITTLPQYHVLAQKIADHWSGLGVKTSVRVESSVSRDFQVLLAALDVPPDPDQYPFWHSTQTQSNVTGYANIKIDKLLEDGRQELDPKKRQEIYADFQRRLVDDAPAIFLYYPKSYTVRRVK